MGSKAHPLSFPAYKPRHKYHAKPSEWRGRKYASKLEMRYAKYLAAQQELGVVCFYLEQVPIRIPGGKLVIDFVEFLANGEVVFTEVKGHETEQWILKQKAVEVLYPLKINVIKSKNMPSGY